MGTGRRRDRRGEGEGWGAGYLAPDRIEKAARLKLALTAGIGSDHVDLPSAAKAGITVAEVTGAPPPLSCSWLAWSCFFKQDKDRNQLLHLLKSLDILESLD